MKKILEIFNETLLALNLTITEEQQEPIFSLINRKFFSNVQPIYKFEDKDYFYENIVSLDGIIKNKTFKIVSFWEEVGENEEALIMAKVIPLDYSLFELPYSYQDAYQTICEMLLERFESYNMQTLRGLGVNDIDTKIDISYQEVDEYLFKKFNIVKASLLI